MEQHWTLKVLRGLTKNGVKTPLSFLREAVRVSGTKRDDLQDAIELVKKSITDFLLQYENFRN